MQWFQNPSKIFIDQQLFIIFIVQSDHPRGLGKKQSCSVVSKSIQNLYRSAACHYLSDHLRGLGKNSGAVLFQNPSKIFIGVSLFSLSNLIIHLESSISYNRSTSGSPSTGAGHATPCAEERIEPVRQVWLVGLFPHFWDKPKQNPKTHKKSMSIWWCEKTRN